MPDLHTTDSTVHKERFHIEGMDCHEEFTLIRNRLCQSDGIGAIHPNYLRRTLSIEYDKSRITVEQIISIIRKLGFVAKRDSEPLVDSPWWQPAHKTICFFISLFCLTLSGIFELSNVWLHTNFSFTLILALLSISTLLTGYSVFLRGLQLLLRGIIDMNTLMTIAITGSFLLAILYGEQPFEAATVVCLFSIASTIETLSVRRSRKVIHALMKQESKQVLCVENKTQTWIPVEAIAKDMLLLVRPGDQIPVDAVVVDGNSSVNESAITGEAIPRDKYPGNSVYGGSINGEGTLRLRASSTAGESTLAKIINLVDQAHETRAPTQQLIDRFASWYTPVVIAIAALISSMPLIIHLFGLTWLSSGWHFWIYRSLVTLVIACPCALVISTPISIICGLTKAARSGILVKGGLHLENAGRLKAIVFDKTGTLTTGTLNIEKIVPGPGENEANVLCLAAAVEQHSEHPLAQSIVREARSRNLEIPDVKDFVSKRGYGARALIDNQQIIVGHKNFFLSFCSSVPKKELVSILDNEIPDTEPQTTTIVGTPDKIIGILFFTDSLRPESGDTFSKLRQLGIEQIEVLTGDRYAAAENITAELPSHSLKAELLPDQKLQRIVQLQKRYQYVAMVGDGVNDAPALAAATIGISMGNSGSDIAMETSDISLMTENLCLVPDIIQLSRNTHRIIVQNICWVLGLKLCCLAMIPIPTIGKLMWIAVLADMGTSLVVIFNSLRLAAEKSD